MRATRSNDGHDDPPEIALHGKVLYIEDEPVNYALVEALLANHAGVELIRAETGLDGVRLAHSEHPDAILLDMHLPDISGVEVVRRLSTDIAARRFRVTLLTADRLNIDVLKAMSLGAFEYLVKPVDAHALEQAVARALAVRPAAVRPPDRPLSHSGARR